MKKFRVYSNHNHHKYRWVEYEAENHLEACKKFFDRVSRVWDTDICGDKTIFYAVREDIKNSQIKYYICKYSYWVDYDPEWNLYDEITWDETTKDQTEGLVGDRDWLKI